MKTSFFDILRSNIVSFLKVSIQYASNLISNLHVTFYTLKYKIYHLLIKLLYRFSSKSKDSKHVNLKIYDPYGSIEYVIASKLANTSKHGSKHGSMLSSRQDIHDSLITASENYSHEDFIHDIDLIINKPDIPRGYEMVEAG